MTSNPPPYPSSEIDHPEPITGYPPPLQPSYPVQGCPPQGCPPQGCPPQGYPPNQQYSPQGANPVVVVAQPYTPVEQTFKQYQVQTVCPNCCAHIITTLHYESGLLTWMVCLSLFLCGCNTGCCLIPFCLKDCKDVVHSCPSCKQDIARWNRL